jgi:hypothetical protein
MQTNDLEILLTRLYNAGMVRDRASNVWAKNYWQQVVVHLESQLAAIKMLELSNC